ncbi:hypothetical protein TRVL_06750 [Trypanosoma vivax]|uniref:Uncharacterized protein n=1 Tax=Trypanosoma vivax (strain Y486) TaxID=1055687 RepID=G0TYF1_TRYVY|nr:hypothetical protein TRVL_06750 [Trypanosoma vivax]CCC48998.1 hypothetical protein, unlikely [Trypanosoma vivax Y486]
MSTAKNPRCSNQYFRHKNQVKRGNTANKYYWRRLVKRGISIAADNTLDALMARSGVREPRPNILQTSMGHAKRVTKTFTAAFVDHKAAHRLPSLRCPSTKAESLQHSSLGKLQAIISIQ